MIITKSIDLSFKDLDPQTRKVTFLASRFGNVDSDNEVIKKGAFERSIRERGPESQSNRKLKFLRYHDFEHQIGKIEAIEESNEGLLVTAVLGRSTKGNDAFLDYQDGIITEHSIGFIPERESITDEGIRVFEEVNLFEVSAVTFGANAETPVFNVSKGLDKDAYDRELKRLNEKMNRLIGALANGKGTDDRLYDIECDLRFCQKRFNDLLVLGSPSVKTEKPQESNSIQLFYQLIK